MLMLDPKDSSDACGGHEIANTSPGIPSLSSAYGNQIHHIAQIRTILLLLLPTPPPFAYKMTKYLFILTVPHKRNIGFHN